MRETVPSFLYSTADARTGEEMFDLWSETTVDGIVLAEGVVSMLWLKRECKSESEE